MFDLDHPFYRPLWLRIAIVIVCFGWGAIEGLLGSTGFAMLFIAVGALAAYRFFWTFNPRDDTTPPK